MNEGNRLVLLLGGGCDAGINLRVTRSSDDSRARHVNGHSHQADSCKEQVDRRADEKVSVGHNCTRCNLYRGAEGGKVGVHSIAAAQASLRQVELAQCNLNRLCSLVTGFLGGFNLGRDLLLVLAQLGHLCVDGGHAGEVLQRHVGRLASHGRRSHAYCSEGSEHRHDAWAGVAAVLGGLVLGRAGICRCRVEAGSVEGHIGRHSCGR